MSRHCDPRAFERARSTTRRGRYSHQQTDLGTVRTVLLAAVFVGLGYATLTSPSPTLSGGAVLSGESVRVEDPWAIGIIDGDTFRYHGEKIRIADIDAPETHPPRCAREAKLGAAATRRMEVLLEAGPFDLSPGGDGRDEDVYGRKLRIVTRDGQSLGETLIGEGLAHRWVGHKLPWCE